MKLTSWVLRVLFLTAALAGTSMQASADEEPGSTPPATLSAPAENATPSVSNVTEPSDNTGLLDSAAPSQAASTEQANADTSLATAPDAAPAEENSPQAIEALLPHDLTPMGMFNAADWVVKAVMLGLAFASLVTWTVALYKGIEILRAKRRARQLLNGLGESGTLRDALAVVKGDNSQSAVMVQAAEYELVLSARHEAFDKEGVKERVDSRLNRVEAQAARRMNLGTGVLATIGSTSPFVGLFGTVWGIMNSFIGISQSQTTNLAVVAPGIAEALLATAIGLVAAIPAVVLYNHFARSIGAYKALMADTSAEVGRIVSRDLDRQPIATPLRKVGS
ncbi:tonB-system energizer ExbB [Pokkaliibacter sp. CJK22405]|uniref:tonB-system energizer ExbB n=1 Tax=Pokkaliibacter sp. CJK22405 TaxID=3384615 RepID=UPI003984D1EB